VLVSPCLRLHEALRLGVVVRIAAPAHRTDEAVLGEELAIRLGSILRAAIRMVHASRRRPPHADGGLQRGEREAVIDRAADRVTDHPS
jgi:hypothetical protein